MPIINRQDAEEVDQYIRRFFASPGEGRAQALRRLFVEKLDFAAATGAVSLARAPKNVALPPTAERIASMEGLHVVYVPLSGSPASGRVRKAEAAAAARLVAGELHGDLLLVMTNPSCNQLHVIYPTFAGATPSLRRMIVERDLPRRTAVQQLSNIYWHWKESGSACAAVDKAFDVDAITKEFFREYKRIFDGVMVIVNGFGTTDIEKEAKKLFVQTMFNRLMFIYFLSRKGWLKFKGDPDYLNAVRERYTTQSEDKSFYASRLKLLFFAGLNNDTARDVRNPVLASLIGDVPFLNGGLFEETDLDKRPGITVPDGAIYQILHELFDRFNFTVMESTPFDVEVAVDPEMLGKVFEELVTGRHESGSYYTPRPVVAFMCREALKGYLETQNTGASTEAIAAFVDHKDSSGLTLSSAPKIGEALARVKVVDPACGSGAYLLGMMQELVELMTTLYSAQLSHEAQDLYNLKLRIIGQNLYGADIDQFAVNIAMLRLWLSLAIEYDGDVNKLPPLPNLDFKIVCGDSLLGPDPSPENYGTLFRHRVHELAGQLATLKGRHMKATGQEKANLTKEVEGLKAELREALTDAAAPDRVVDWRVEFAEVFDQNGGFDVVVANPPYVRHQRILPKTYKDRIVSAFSGAATGRSDLCIFFYARGLQLLRPGGMHVFICSNSWLDADYGESLQRHLVKQAHIKSIYNSAVERQFSTAAINTIMSVIQKSTNAEYCSTRFVNFLVPMGNMISQQVELSTDVARVRTVDSLGQVKTGKWGSRYLRAPLVFDKLESLVGTRLTTVDKEFTVESYLILPKKADQVIVLPNEEVPLTLSAYFAPFIRSPKYHRTPLVTQTPYSVLRCTANDVQADSALRRFVRDSEQRLKDEFDSGNLKDTWFVVGQAPAQVLWQRRFGERHLVFFNSINALSYDFYKIVYRKQLPEDFLLRAATVFLSSFTWLSNEVLGRTNLGEGALKIEGTDIQAIPIPRLASVPREAFKHADMLLHRESLSLEEELEQSDRWALDQAIAGTLGLSRDDVREIHEGIMSLTKGRLEKAENIQQ